MQKKMLPKTCIAACLADLCPGPGVAGEEGGGDGGEHGEVGELGAVQEMGFIGGHAIIPGVRPGSVSWDVTG